jgi:hypothetical protein
MCDRARRQVSVPAQRAAARGRSRRVRTPHHSRALTYICTCICIKLHRRQACARARAAHFVRGEPVERRVVPRPADDEPVVRAVRVLGQLEQQRQRLDDPPIRRVGAPRRGRADDRAHRLAVPARGAHGGGDGAKGRSGSAAPAVTAHFGRTGAPSTGRRPCRGPRCHRSPTLPPAARPSPSGGGTAIPRPEPSRSPARSVRCVRFGAAVRPDGRDARLYISLYLDYMCVH